MKPDSRLKTVITRHSLRGCETGRRPFRITALHAWRDGQSPIFAAASVVASTAADAVFLAAVVVAFALLFGAAEVFFAVDVAFLAVDLADFLAVVVVLLAAFVACVLVVFALAVVVWAAVAVAFVDSCVRIRPTRTSPRLARSAYAAFTVVAFSTTKPCSSATRASMTSRTAAGSKSRPPRR